MMAAAVVSAAPADTALNILGVPAAPLRFAQTPTAAEFATAYPHGAAAVGLGGEAWLHCKVGDGGRLQDCDVSRERPQGAGFGRAALNLSRFYRLDPASPAAKAGVIDAPVRFAIAADDDRVLVSGPWLAAPSFAQVAAAYPDIGGGVTGEAALHCDLNHDGSLSQCKANYQHPPDRDFGDAALKLSKIFRLRVGGEMVKSFQPMSVNVFMRLPPPFGPQGQARPLSDPIWLTGPNLTAQFPALAKAKGVVAGVGLVDCTVAPDGALTGCQPVGPGDPPGLGFSEAAAKTAQAMRMSPWTADGGPIDGAHIRLSLRLSVAADPGD
jgi:TonB family protein